MISSSRSMLYRFLILYGSLYAGFGVQSPYLPILLDNRHLRPETIALALSAGAAMRLMAAQAVARLADRLDAPKVFLALCTTAAALIGLGYLPAQGAWLLIAVGVLHSAALAPLPPLSDTLALGAAAPAGSGGAVIHYGWLRGCGSAAFALGLVLSGQVIGHFGIVVIVWLNAALLAAAAPMPLGVPQLLATGGHARATPSQARGVGVLLRLSLYRKLPVVILSKLEPSKSLKALPATELKPGDEARLRQASATFDTDKEISSLIILSGEFRDRFGALARALHQLFPARRRMAHAACRIA